MSFYFVFAIIIISKGAWGLLVFFLFFRIYTKISTSKLQKKRQLRSHCGIHAGL